MYSQIRVLFGSFVFILCFASASVAVDISKADQIISFFEEQKAIQNTRGICVGTDEECTAAELKDHSAAFDLRINFEKGSANLTEDARKNLIEFSIALQNSKLANLHFSIDGFTDSTGGADYNLELSKKRSLAAVAFLKTLGVNENMLLPRGWGATNFLVADTKDPINRRVEARLLKSK